MDKIKLIKLLSQSIEDICDKDEKDLKFQNGKLKFRQYERLGFEGHQLSTIDITIEF